jgi:hypothetical protein
VLAPGLSINAFQKGTAKAGISKFAAIIPIVAILRR